MSASESLSNTDSLNSRNTVATVVMVVFSFLGKIGGKGKQTLKIDLAEVIFSESV